MRSSRSPRRRRGRLGICALLVAAVLLPSGSAVAAEQGTVRLARGAESSFDAYTASPSPTAQSWMRDHYWRMRTYAPYFNSRLSWYRDAWAYQDAYAIYPNAPEASTHPEWILKDPSGNKLWIQFACSNGSCTQYAADIGNPAYRAFWIADAKRRLAAGYKGLFIDDVNMAQRVSDGQGRYTMPLDPRTGTTMDETAWMKYMADFMVEVRAALPGVEIVHNTIWTMGDATADLKRQLNAADYTYLERGFVDSGITGGGGKFGFQTLAAFIDRRHAAGHPVILDGYTTDPQWREYGLATYLLLNDGSDALGNDAANRPDAFWSGYDVHLGTAAGGRYATGGVWRRDFAQGSVLVNEPGNPTRVITVGAGYQDVNGVALTSVTLAGAAGAVLIKSAPAVTPTPTETVIDPTVTPTPTSTPTPTPPTHADADHDADAHDADAHHDAGAHTDPRPARPQASPSAQGPGRLAAGRHEDDRSRHSRARPRPRHRRDLRPCADRRAGPAREALGPRPPRPGDRLGGRDLLARGGRPAARDLPGSGPVPRHGHGAAIALGVSPLHPRLGSLACVWR